MRFRALLAAALLLAACSGLGGLSGGDDDSEPHGGGDASADGTANGGATVTVTKPGTGHGIVISQDRGLDCGGACSRMYSIGALVALSATPSPGSAFNGWGPPCGGTGACFVQVAGDVTVTASFNAMVLDIDGNGQYEPLTDGLLASRYMFGFTGTALTDGVIGANARRSDPAVVLSYLNGVRSKLDIDGNGTLDSLTDGLLIERYLSGLRGSALTASAIGSGATRMTPAEIEDYLRSLTP
jgi:hypothetical protein